MLEAMAWRGNILELLVAEGAGISIYADSLFARGH